MRFEYQQSKQDTTTAVTIGTGQDNLRSFVIEKNSHIYYRGARVTASGTITNTNGNKTIKFHFGSQSITFHPAFNDDEDWNFTAEIMFASATIHRCSWKGFHTSVTHGNDTFTDSLSTGDVTIKITGECANASDTITQNLFLLEMF